MRLTKRTVDALTLPASGTVTHYDDALPGFGVRVAASGRKTYVVRYRTKAGTERLFTFARVVDMHPEAARDMARDLFASVRRGEDPADARRTARNASTVGDLRDRMEEDHTAHKKAATRRNYALLWRLHIVPVLGEGTAIADVTEADVERIRRRLGTKRTTCNRALAVLSKAFNLAERWGLRPRGTNPVRYVERHPERKRERFLDPDELARVWASLDTVDAPESARSFFRLLILTGLRESEWRTARWEWVDRAARVLRIPDTKTGERIVPLTDPVLAILDTLPKRGPYVLPGRFEDRPLGGHRRIWRRVLEAAGVPHVRIHDIRHTAGSMAHLAGASQREVADMLGHRQLATAARYIHGPATEKHRAAERAASAILAAAVTSGPRR